MPIEYRFCDEADVPELDRMWEAGTEWGKERFYKWYLAAPFGAPKIVMATDTETGRAVGQFRFLPSLVSVDGREVAGSRPFGTIVTPEMRRAIRSPNPLEQPAIAMYMFAAEALRAEGCGMIHMVPDPRWLRILKMFPFVRTGSFPLWSIPLPLAEPIPLGDGFSAGPLEGWDERVDGLWERASRLHGSLIVRDLRTLEWKIGNGFYTVTAVERGGELVGLVGALPKGEGQWLICDLLAADADESLRATLAAACNAGDRCAAESPKPLRKAAVLTTPVMETAVRELGFKRDQYDFPLAIHVLAPSLDKRAVDPARWYASAND